MTTRPPPPTTLSPLLRLPTEIQTSILSYLPSLQQYRLRRVCLLWQDILTRLLSSYPQYESSLHRFYHATGYTEIPHPNSNREEQKEILIHHLFVSTTSRFGFTDPGGLQAFILTSDGQTLNEQQLTSSPWWTQPVFSHSGKGLERVYVDMCTGQEPIAWKYEERRCETHDTFDWMIHAEGWKLTVGGFFERWRKAIREHQIDGYTLDEETVACVELEWLRKQKPDSETEASWMGEQSMIGLVLVTGEAGEFPVVWLGA